MHSSIALASSEFLPLIDVARVAEERGYHRLWTTETPARDATVRALTLALNTSTIQVGTGIAYAFTRSPLALAATASDIYEASSGRFSIGLGAGTRGMRKHWYGIDDFDAPALRLAEYADLMRAAWASATDFTFSGRFYRSRYDQLGGARPAPPLWGSGLNPTMLQVAARHFDGVAVHALAAVPAYLDAVAMPAIDKGRSHCGRQVQVAAWKLASVGQDGEEARAKCRAALAFYFSTPSYARVADITGWTDTAARIRTALAESGPQWRDIARLIPDEMLDQFCIAGTPARAREAWSSILADYEKRGIDEIVIQTTSTDEPGPAAVRAILDLVNTFAPG